MDLQRSGSVYASSSKALAEPPVLFRAICLFDFTSEDPSHLPFKRGDLLAVLKTEYSGWSGARDKTGAAGWVPTQYLAPLTNEQVNNLESVPDAVRFFEYEAEIQYRNAPVRDPRAPLDQYMPIPNYTMTNGRDAFPDLQDTISLPPYESPSPSSPATVSNRQYSSDGYSPDQESEGETSPIPQLSNPRSPQIQIPDSSHINKPTPPTPIIINATSHSSSHPYHNNRMLPPTPDPLIGGSSAHPVSPNITPISHNSLSTDDDDLQISRPFRSSEDKVKAILGDPEASSYYAKQNQASAWYLQPQHAGENSGEVQVEHDNSIKAGTIDALIERLVIGFERSKMDKKFRRTFLTTFKTFTSAEQLMESLWAQYRMDPPSGLTSREEQNWLINKLRPTQIRVLKIFKEWLEHFWLVDDDPHLIPRIQQKLSQVSDSSATQALSVKDISQSIERLLANRRNGALSPRVASSSSTKSSNKKVKTDILHVEHHELANQLTLFESRLYSELQARECLVWHKVQTGEPVQNLVAFVSHSNKLAGWVKHSILSRDRLGERADTVDKWIRVAEKCRLISNISSTCSIVAALSSSVIERLHLTWARVERKGQLVPLQNLAQPNNNFRECRELLRAIDKPCVPFIGMNLTDLTHIQDGYPDNIVIDPSSDYPQGLTLINFAKRQACVDVIDSILRHQSKPYRIAEKPAMITFLEQQLALSAHEDSWFWHKSQELQQAEVAHADIKRNLEAAGF